jgi:hypothetical protein
VEVEEGRSGDAAVGARERRATTDPGQAGRRPVGLGACNLRVPMPHHAVGRRLPPTAPIADAPPPAHLT